LAALAGWLITQLTNTIAASGWLNFTNTASTNYSKSAFYRARLVNSGDQG